MEQLKQIKLLRKLGVPLEEIRRMQSGGHTVGDGMRRHLVTLERERENLERSMGAVPHLRIGNSAWTPWRRMAFWSGWRRWSGRAPPLRTSSGRMQGQCGMPPPWPLR